MDGCRPSAYRLIVESRDHAPSHDDATGSRIPLTSLAASVYD